MLENNSNMGWNPPSQGPDGSKDSRPQNQDREPLGGENQNDNPWTRPRRNNENDVGQFFKKAEKILSNKAAWVAWVVISNLKMVLRAY